MPLHLNAESASPLSHGVAPDGPCAASQASASADTGPGGTDLVLSRWARSGGGGPGGLRHALVDGWLARATDAPPPSMPPTPAARLAWQRLAEVDLPRLMASWLNETRASPGPHDADRCGRLCHAVDRIMSEDTIAALVAAHGRPAEDAATPDRRLAAMEAVVAFADAVPGPRLAPSSSALLRSPGSPSSRAGSDTPSTHGRLRPAPGRDLSSPGGLSSPEGLESLLSQVSLHGDPAFPRSAIPPTPPTPRTPQTPPMPGRELNLPAFERLLSQGSFASPGGLPSINGEFWRLAESAPSSPPPRQERLALPPLLGRREGSPLPWLSIQRPAMDGGESPDAADGSSDVPALPSFASVHWLPSINFASPESGPPSARAPGSPALSRPLIDDTLTLLSTPDDAPFTAADRILRRRAIEAIEAHRASPSSPSSAAPAREVLDLVRQASARSLHMGGQLRMDEDGTGMAWNARDPESRQALTALAAWVEAAGGVEAVRRERWVELLSYLTYDAGAPFLLPAALLADGAELPPEPLLRALIPDEQLPDRGTLLWRGERLGTGDELSRLLERLALRHLDIQATRLPPGPLPESLRRADIGVVTLHRSERLAPNQAADLLKRLEDALPALYLIRLERREPLPPAWLPAPWTADAQRPGWLLHRQRDDNRQRLASLRDLWRGGRIPPSLRQRAVNVLPDGEPVLAYFAHVHDQRSQDRQFRVKDVTLCARLATVVDGLADDPAFARRCRAMAESPLGPCADGGTQTLAAMASLREMSEAESLSQLAENAFIQACLMRADAHAAAEGSAADPRREEVLELAMVLRWYVAQRLAALLGADRIRVTDKPMFGTSGAGRGWDREPRRGDFLRQALTLLAQEVEAGFAGVQVMVSTPEHPLNQDFLKRIDREIDLSGLASRERAIMDAYAAALERDEDDAIALARATAALGELEAARAGARFAALQPTLDAIAAAVRRELASEVPADEALEEPPAKRHRLDER